MLTTNYLFRIEFEYKVYKDIFKNLRQRSFGPSHTDADRDYFAMSCISMCKEDPFVYDLPRMERDWQEYKTNIENEENVK